MVKIEVTGTTVSGDGRLLNDAKLKAGGDMSIRVDNAQILDNAAVLENLTAILEDAGREAQNGCGLNEYEAIRELQVLEQQGRREKLLPRIAEHLKEFSQGVLAKTIAECLKKITE